MKLFNHIWKNKERKFFFSQKSDDPMFNWYWTQQSAGFAGLHQVMFIPSIENFSDDE
jgi:hypothetical protein